MKTHKKCYNCTHAGNQFKLDKKTHLHCGHHKLKKELENGKLSHWDTLREFWETCEEHTSFIK